MAGRTAGLLAPDVGPDATDDSRREWVEFDELAPLYTADDDMPSKSRREIDDDHELADDPSTALRMSAELPLLAKHPASDKSLAAVGRPGLRFRRRRPSDADAIATQSSVFDDPETAKYYQPRADWENIHRFDPSARWSWSEEDNVVRKIDWKIMLFTCIMFMVLELDRANLTQVVTDNFLDDLGLDTNDYNWGNTVFKFSFLCAELPSQLISKYLGPDRWVPLQMTLWSIVACSQFWLSGRGSFLLTRALLGMMQGGFIADMILYLSYFYKHSELSIRLGFFWTAGSVSDIIASLLGAGLLRLRGVAGLAGWRWLFLIEGLLTLIVGLIAFPMMPAGPCETAGWFRGPTGWFTEREEVIMVNRIIREDPSKSGMHNREPITLSLLWQSLTDFDLWPLYLLGLNFETPMITPQQYMTLILRGFGFSTLTTNLLVIPSQIGHILTMLLFAYLAEIVRQLWLFGLLAQLWLLPLLSIIYVYDLNAMNPWKAWAILTVLLACPNVHAIQVGWNSRNSNSVRSRTVSAALYNMAVQTSGIIASQIYREEDRPRYRQGNRTLLSLCGVNICLYIATKAYYTVRNQQKERKWNAMIEGERERYLQSNLQKGNKRLDFRFAS